jgi:hypothetical protein
MSAGFFRRFFSTIVDMIILFTVIYFSFILFGRTLLQNNIENFDEINQAYSEIMVVYNQNMSDLQQEYDVAKELAGDDEELKAIALNEYLEKVDILDQQNLVDIDPYNDPLSLYFSSAIYYYALLFLVLITALTLFTKGMTPGRRVMQLKLVGPINPASIFLHDVVFKYLLIIILIPINILFSFMLIMFMFLIDFALLVATRNKNTIRDMITKLTVEKIGYKY